MPDEVWKEQLGFTSGTVLVWAVVLMKLFPVAAAVQLPNGLEFIDSRGYAGTEVVAFCLLTLFGALGITDFLLAVLHIGSRGLWLASTTDGENADKAFKIDRFCQRTFVLVFSVARYVAASLVTYPFVLAATELQRDIHRLFSVESRFVGDALYFFALMAVGVTLYFFALMAVSLVSAFRGGTLVLRRAIAELFESGLPRSIRILNAAFYRWISPTYKERVYLGLMFMPVAFASFFLSYKAELSVSKTIYDKTSTAADVNVQLGGMTSNVTKLRLALVNSKGETIRTISTFDLGEGNYVARVGLSGLSPGRYGVLLEYPYIDVSLAPVRVQHLRRQKWFIIDSQ